MNQSFWELFLQAYQFDIHIDWVMLGRILLISIYFIGNFAAFGAACLVVYSLHDKKDRLPRKWYVVILVSVTVWYGLQYAINQTLIQQGVFLP